MGKTIPIVDYLVLDDGAPYLVANESTESGALYFDRRNADARTGKPGFRRTRVADTGVVRTFTIVHRAAPGVPTPYVSVVVDLDGGGVVKANLLNVEPDARRGAGRDAGASSRRTSWAWTTTAPRRSRSPTSRPIRRLDDGS